MRHIAASGTLHWPSRQYNGATLAKAKTKDGLLETQGDINRRKRKPHARNPWLSMENQRAFLEELRQKHSIALEDQRGWRAIGHREVNEMGGRGLLARYPSLMAALAAVYPEMDWDVTKCRKQVPFGYWDAEKSGKEAFADRVGSFLKRAQSRYSIRRGEEWSRISHKQLHAIPGAHRLLRRHALPQLLQIAFPDGKWKEMERPSGRRRAEQRWLAVQTKSIFFG